MKSVPGRGGRAASLLPWLPLLPPIATPFRALNGVLVAAAVLAGTGEAPRALGPAFGQAAGSARGTTEPAEAPPAEPLSTGPRSFRLQNRFAYIPPQCYVRTRGTRAYYGSGGADNPCFVCHLRSNPPNFADDADLQFTLSFPPGARANPWTNLLTPPEAQAPLVSADEILRYVRQSNYFSEDGTIALQHTLTGIANESPNTGFRGYWPDVSFSFDDHGFDHRPDGSFSGWRAFAYYPFPGAFFPTNGSMDDVLVRLDPVLQEDAHGRFDRATYEANLAIVLATVRAQDPARAPTAVGRSRSRPAIGHSPRYAGLAGTPAFAARFPINAGLFPLGTEFFHSVRYLDVAADGSVTLAARMKELRYAKKVQWLAPADLQKQAGVEAVEQARGVDGAVHHAWQYDRGISNGQGWLFQGFIEGCDGSLRPQSFEESVACVGCHGGIGATTDSIFAFPRKLEGDVRAEGWFHPTGAELQGLPEPITREGIFEYTQYLARSGAGDDFRQNEEVQHRFFDERGALRDRAVTRLHEDVASLLMPSAPRALDLDRAYLAIVRTQSYARGRESLALPSRDVYVRVPLNASTAIKDDSPSSASAIFDRPR